MRLRLLERSLRNVLIRTEITLNRRLGREFIPATTETFCIETSSACNLKCRFCAYEKKATPKVSMDNELFFDCVNQALGLGYKEFHLTPCTGDVFMDKHVFDKFEYMDAHEGVRAYHFFTNLTVLDEAKIARLVTLKKLSRLVVSVYGHDEASFVALTKTSPKIYQRLLANLEALLSYRTVWPFKLSIGFRSTFDVPHDGSSELLQIINRYRASGVAVHSSHGVYNNWGGYITQEDVSGLNVHILSSDGVHKAGPCVKLFDSFQVTASGIVTGCSCRDVDATLRIGDIKKQPLHEIISTNNALYMALIQEQEAGIFREVCKNCDYYRSIYHQPSNYRRHKIATQTRAQFLAKLGKGSEVSPRQVRKPLARLEPVGEIRASHRAQDPHRNTK